MLAAIGAPAGAQDSHYWNIQYGPVAQLLGGQVVGSTRDLSATYYNPGGLGLAEETPFLLSVQSFQIESVSLDPAVPSSFFEVESQTLEAAPSLLAGSFPRGWLGRDTRLAWSILTRQRFDLRLSQRFAGDLSEPAARVGVESLLDQRMSEYWGGLTLSRRASERVGVGATLYGAVRSQRTRYEESVQAVEPPGESGLAALNLRDFDYWNARLLAKLGVAWESEALKLGLAVTTPCLALFGSGKAGATLSVTAVDLDGDGQPDSALRNAFEEGLTSDYRSSWAIAGGLATRFGTTQVSASAEWFAPVDRFEVLRLPPGADAELLSLTQELRSVFNTGVGVEHVFTNGTAVYGAFATDFSAAPSRFVEDVSTSSWNLYHLTAGTAFRAAGTRFTLGVSWAVGGRTLEGDTALPPEVPILGLGAPTKVRYSRFKFLLGFLFGGD